MRRRIFTKKALGAIAGGLATILSSCKNDNQQTATPAKTDPKPEPKQVKASASDKQTKASAKKPSKKTLPKLGTLPADKAEEQIKVIQTKRGYYNGHLVSSKSPAKAKGVCTSILFFADVHLVTENLKKIRDFKKTYEKYIDDAVHLGDTVGAYNKGTFTMWNEFPTAMNVIGNHDVYSNQKNKSKRYSVKENWLTDKEKYNFYFKKYIPTWNAVQPENAETEGKCYWYKDYNNHLRLIGVDCMRSTNKAQLDWFKATLKDAIEKKLNVAIATHIPPTCGEKIDCAFTSIDYTKDLKIPYSSGKIMSPFVKEVDEFIGNGGSFVSWICGHLHHDMVMYAKSKHKQFVIVLECATSWEKWTDANHVRGTESETAWDLIGVESITNVIKIARFGNNFDHQMRHKGTFCYDFKKHKVITVS